MMKKDTVIISMVTIIICLILVSGQDVVATNSWDAGSTTSEHGAWKQELNRWDVITSVWAAKVTPSYLESKDDCDGDKCWTVGPVSASYCVGKKCWKSTPNTFTIIDFEGNSVNIGKGRCAMSSDWFISDGNKWSCSNGNQVNEFVGQQKEKWKSSNFGQILEYTNKIGDIWKSSNHGQTIVFEGVNGEKWKSSNHGQSVEHVDESGEKWDGSKYDTENRF